MKVLYSELKMFLPALKAGPKEVANAFTYIGMMVDGYKEVRMRGQKDILLSLEVRQNRPDCLGVVGLAREIGAYFKVALVLPKVKLPVAHSDLAIEVKVPALVKRVSALQIDGLDNSQHTPKWLNEALAMHDMKSISFLVDISNYAMLMTGFPNHLFDAGKVVGKLTWQKATKDENFTTLDGTTLQFEKNRELVISDNLGPLVLAGCIGGRRSALSARTNSVIAEVAVYDPKKVREDARKHRLQTEASNRLEKQLAVEHSLWALEYLASLLLGEGRASLSTKIVDIFPRTTKPSQQVITWPIISAEKVGGIPVSSKESRDILVRLGFEVVEVKGSFRVTVPVWRNDVEGIADITEEVLRLKGFQNIIPIKPSFTLAPVLTPPIITLIDESKQILQHFGFDEVLTLPLTSTKANQEFLQDDLRVEVRTQNAINEEYPVLRTNLLSGLLQQQEEYLKRGLNQVQIFEIGKVFWKSPKKYQEEEHLAVLVQCVDSQVALRKIYETLEGFLRQLGISNLYFENIVSKATAFEKDLFWEVKVGEVTIGFLGVAKRRPLSGNKLIVGTAIAEIGIGELIALQSKEKNKGPTEILGKMAILDANILVSSQAELNSKLLSVKKKYNKNIWAVEVRDRFLVSKQSIKFTLRITYLGLSETAAKKLHKQIFPA
jgi:phenylalanyl-tRNA synthetase beta chain